MSTTKTNATHLQRAAQANVKQIQIQRAIVCVITRTQAEAKALAQAEALVFSENDALTHSRTHAHTHTRTHCFVRLSTHALHKFNNNEHCLARVVVVVVFVHVTSPTSAVAVAAVAAAGFATCDGFSSVLALILCGRLA